MVIGLKKTLQGLARPTHQRLCPVFQIPHAAHSPACVCPPQHWCLRCRRGTEHSCSLPGPAPPAGRGAGGASRGESGFVYPLPSVSARPALWSGRGQAFESRAVGCPPFGAWRWRTWLSSPYQTELYGEIVVEILNKDHHTCSLTIILQSVHS